jgi:hypothetical protein
MDPVVILLIIVISVITTLLVVVGIHLVHLLREAKKTIQKTNDALDGVNHLLDNLHTPLGQRGGLVAGVKTGLNLAQAFAHFLVNNHASDSSHDPKSV